MELRLPGPEQRLSFIAKKSLDLLSPFLTKESKGSIEAYLPIATSSSARKYGDETHKLLDGISLGENQDMDGQDNTVGVSETEGDFKEGKVKGKDKVSHCSEVDDLPVNDQSFDDESPAGANSADKPRAIAARASACVAVGLVKNIRRPIIRSLTATRVNPACSIRPARINPAPRVSITLAACMRV